MSKGPGSSIVSPNGQEVESRYLPVFRSGALYKVASATAKAAYNLDTMTL
jgi:hypothetical protein